ncbi:hydrolase [Niveibacterium sp. SC-1]|uniref:hydrolase n=1 Tax=Niveibacterium sp. SC-1 TaxID=3135646 RepID=UPI00311E7DA8
MHNPPPRYVAPRWLSGRHAQTIWPLAIKGPMPAVTRERWEAPDGDFIDVDLLPHKPGKPLVLMFHGLEGSSRSHYTRALLRVLEARGWNGAIPHFRGCSGEPNRLLRAYHSGDADEVAWVLARFAERFPDVPRYASGVSLGGNALLVWLGREGAAAKTLVRAAASICAPLDLAICGHNLARGFNKLYTRHFLYTLKRTATHKLRRFPDSFDHGAMRRARNLYEFDNAVTAPLHGFANTEDYWTRASARPLLRTVRVPTLVLNARNDPFVPTTALPDSGEISPAVTLETPEGGGHVGFVTGSFPGTLDWLPRRILHFFEHGN